GSHMLHRSTNRAASWTPISPDLTNGPVPNFSAYATITTIDVAKTDSNIIMVGTDDGNVWVTTNLGASWIDINAGLPNRWITRVRFDPTNHNIAYVTLSGFRLDSPLPHIFRTTNLGQTWQDISSNLPEAPINVVLVDPLYTNRLYVGTDVGCFFTTNTGASWQAMGTGLPNAAISDMQIHAPTRIALAFTHGRSMWEIHLDDLTAVAENREIPVRMELQQNYPNPFNPTTTISFTLSRSAFTRLEVFDINGRKVATLMEKELSAGSHRVVFDAADRASGVYFYRLTAGGSSQTRRMLLMK
ncbi:MAG TPA: T9SS type A sorting domain-containing protein, partial [Bacteroidota bacterium]|nr:T9SS type A sorting domain-containing protein [Bacteroidota bacterium]